METFLEIVLTSFRFIERSTCDDASSHRVSAARGAARRCGKLGLIRTPFRSSFVRYRRVLCDRLRRNCDALRPVRLFLIAMLEANTALADVRDSSTAGFTIENTTTLSQKFPSPRQWRPMNLNMIPAWGYELPVSLTGPSYRQFAKNNKRFRLQYSRQRCGDPRRRLLRRRFMPAATPPLTPSPPSA